MLLAVDVGNTQTILGAFEDDRLRAHWRLATRKEITSDELGMLLRSFFETDKIAVSDVDGLIVSSVVPDLDAVFLTLGARMFDVEPLFVGPGIRTGIPILYDNPHEVGASTADSSRWTAPRRGYAPSCHLPTAGSGCV